MSPRLSVLDQSPIGRGRTAAQALRDSVVLAGHADRLGYHRYWVAEHHGSPAFAGTAPEILAGRLLEATDRLRVGSGGVLLPRYRPDKVAEAFQVLAALHPGRVDLGIGRAGGHATDFPRSVDTLLRLLGVDGGAPPPPVWLLGSSTGSAQLSAALGTSFCFAHFLNPDAAEAASDAVRRDRAPGTEHALAVRVVTAEDPDHAEELRHAYLLWRSRKDLGTEDPFPDVDTARRHRWTPAETNRAAAHARAVIAGPPAHVRAELGALAAKYGVDEIIITMLTHDPADRASALRLLAEGGQDRPNPPSEASVRSPADPVAGRGAV